MSEEKKIPYIEETYDVVVVGAGHAGCEAALACARLGLETMMFTVSVDSIALMPCNPNIGGSSKGHLVREIDALGGEMGKIIDKTFIQSKMLNKSKGPAVHSLRAQADKAEYTKEMRKTLQNTDHLSIRQAEVAEILTNKDGFFPEDDYHEGSTENYGSTDRFWWNLPVQGSGALYRNVSSGALSDGRDDYPYRTERTCSGKSSDGFSCSAWNSYTTV